MNLAIRKCRTYPAPMGRNHRFAVVLGLIEEVAMAGESTEPIERRVAPLAKSVLFIRGDSKDIL